MRNVSASYQPSDLRILGVACACWAKSKAATSSTPGHFHIEHHHILQPAQGPTQVQATSLLDEDQAGDSKLGQVGLRLEYVEATCVLTSEGVRQEVQGTNPLLCPSLQDHVGVS